VENIDTAPLLHLLRQHLPGILFEHVTPILSGWDSWVLDLDGNWIFRFPRRPEVASAMEREVRLLSFLDGRLPAGVPRVVYQGRQDENGPLLFCGYARLPGDGLDSTGAAMPALAQQIGEFLSRLHQLQLPAAFLADFPAATPQDWRNEYREEYRWAQEQVFPLLPEDARRDAHRVWLDYLEQPANFEFQPVFIHGDLGPEHLLYDQVRATLTGVIDWQDARWGDPALDFVGLYWLAGWDLVQNVLQHYIPSSRTNLRQRIEFLHWMMPFHFIKFGLLTHDEQYIRSGVEQILNAVKPDLSEFQVFGR
jgi:aminoglycoside 2''-phosphotransferase